MFLVVKQNYSLKQIIFPRFFPYFTTGITQVTEEESAFCQQYRRFAEQLDDVTYTYIGLNEEFSRKKLNFKLIGSILEIGHGQAMVSLEMLW